MLNLFAMARQRLIAADQISSISSEELHQIGELAAALCKVDMATIKFRSEKGTMVHARIGLDSVPTAKCDLFLEAVERRNGVLIVPDTNLEPTVSRHPYVTGSARIRFFAGAPIRDHQERFVGAVCVFGTAPRLQGLSAVEEKGLVRLADAVSAQLVRTVARRVWDETERFYLAMADLMPEMVWTADSRGAIDYLNPAWLEYTGADPLEAWGSGWARYIHPEDAASVERLWRESTSVGKTFKAECRLRRHSGEYRWFTCRASPLPGAEAAVTRWIGTCADIHAHKIAEQQAQEAAERYRLAARATQDAIWDWDLNTNQVGWGEAAAETLGYTCKAMGSTLDWWKACVHPQDLPKVESSLSKVMKSGEKWEAEYRFQRGDGSYTELYDRGFLVRDRTGKPIRMVGAAMDVSRKNAAERALKASEERLRRALSAAKMVAWERDAKAGTVVRSDNALSLLGLPTAGRTGDSLSRVHQADRDRVANALSANRSSECEFRYLTPWGEILWFAMRGEKAKGGRVVGVTYDISERKKIEKELEYLATVDPLTGLLNRRCFTQTFDAAVKTARKNKSDLSLALIDLDDFKDVNDTLGHEAGDRLLRNFARRLRSLFDPQHTIARLGGDEFAVLLCEPFTRQQSETFIQYVVDRMREQQDFDGRELATRISVGMAHYPEHGRNSLDLMRNADISLYESKKRGRSQATVFSPRLRQQINARVAHLADIQRGLRASEFFPVYQPRIDLRTGEVIGLEALARWAHPTKGLLTPAGFALALEVDDLSAELGREMVKKAAADAAAWLRTGLVIGRVGVNFTAGDFKDPLLADNVLAVFREMGLPSSTLDVEVTERVLLAANNKQIRATLERFRTAGSVISLDDFGTGYASLTHLKHFPVHSIKIDRSFIRDLSSRESDQAIVTAILGLASSLHIAVTAEGVETACQAEWLTAHGCDFGQGYFFSRPVNASDVPALLRNQFWSADTRRRLKLV